MSRAPSASPWQVGPFAADEPGRRYGFAMTFECPNPGCQVLWTRVRRLSRLRRRKTLSATCPDCVVVAKDKAVRRRSEEN